MFCVDSRANRPHALLQSRPLLQLGMTPNTYSRTWFELFLETQTHTDVEVAFLTRNLPNPPYNRVLDLCCGSGRHANRLAREGYEVTGVDVDAAALRRARSEATGNATYVQADMRDLSELETDFDAVLSLWQSFGYFNEATNRAVLRQISHRLRPQGRFILDIYNRAHAEKSQGATIFERRGQRVQAENRIAENRLTARLRYEDGGEDVFEWQLYHPDEITALAASVGLHCQTVCTWFDETLSPSAEAPRMQLVFQKG